MKISIFLLKIEQFRHSIHIIHLTVEFWKLFLLVSSLSTLIIEVLPTPLSPSTSILDQSVSTHCTLPTVEVKLNLLVSTLDKVDRSGVKGILIVSTL